MSDQRSSSGTDDAVSAVMSEAYGMLGLTLTIPQARRLAEAALRTPAITGRGEAQIVSVLKTHLKIGGHDAWEGHYYYVDGIEAAAKAIALSSTSRASPPNAGCSNPLCVYYRGLDDTAVTFHTSRR